VHSSTMHPLPLLEGGRKSCAIRYVFSGNRLKTKKTES
jgi:hypothetical protein